MGYGLGVYVILWGVRVRRGAMLGFTHVVCTADRRPDLRL